MEQILTASLPTFDYIPKDAINVVTQLWMTILNELCDQLTTLGRWLSHFMFTKTILWITIRGGTQHVTLFATRIVHRCVQWLQPSGQAAQWESAMTKVRPACISASSYRLEGDELIIQNAKRAKKLVEYGRASCATHALMSCGVAKSCKRTLGKLLTKLQQADQPETEPLADHPTEPLADHPTNHNFKKGQIMHTVNSILKGTAPGMDSNHAEFYKYCVATPSTTARDTFQRAYMRFFNVLV
jgi:hypothetical protein